MGVEFSEDQLKVIQTRDRNILVSASAGSGKTTVLVERIIQKICDRENPVDIDRLLIVTFTKAAAASMRQKIMEALEEKLLEEPDNLHLQKQVVLIHNAQITTIHSFCLYVLQNNFNDIGLEPGFRVADEGEIRLLKEDIMEQLLESRFSADKKDSFLKLANRFCRSAKLNPLTDVIYDVYDHAMSHPFPLEWLESQKRDYGPDMVYLPEVVNVVKKMISEEKEETGELLQAALSPGGPYVYEDALRKDIALFDSLLKKDSYGELAEAVQNSKIAGLSSKKDDSISPEKREYVKAGKDVIRKSFYELRTNYFSFPLEFMKQEDIKNGEILEELLDTVKEFYQRLQEKKKEKKLIDFTDMEHFALQILLKEGENGYEPTDTAKEYQSHFDEVMVDEYQDSNMVQECILKAVSGEKQGRYNRFMVGDVKQSIYRFRMACPRLFTEKYERYTPDGKQEMRIDLSKNFRSRKEVLDCVNVIFRKIMGKDLGGVEYDQANELYLGAGYRDREEKTDRAELLLIRSDEKGKDSREYEAKAIALRIKKLIQTYQVVDEQTGKLRGATYKDIAILLRVTRQWDEIMKRTLEQYGIPTTIVTREGYFSTVEIQTVLNVLHVLDNPGQDIPLYGVMHSEFGDFTDEELAVLTVAGKEAGLTGLSDAVWQAADSENKKISPELADKCKTFCSFIEMYRSRVKYEPIHQLLRELFDEVSYLPRISALPGGEQKKRNVLMLLEKAEAYEKTSMKGLFSFIKYIEKLKKYDVEVGEAAAGGDGMNAVRIMSIHKSKGLEFPVCIVAGLGSRFSRQDVQKSLICDTDYGIGFDYADLDKRVQYPNLRKNLMKQKITEDNLGEELRVLYVALTRAKEKLILTGTVKTKFQGKPCSGKVPWGIRFKADSPMDWIMSAVMTEDVVDCREMTEDDFAELEVEAGVNEMKRKQALLTAFSQNPRQEEALRFREGLKKQYQHENLKDLYTKTSVSELKIRDMQKAYQKEDREEPAFLMYHDEPEKTLPKFLQEEKKASGSDRGSAYHRVLELLPFEEFPTALKNGTEEPFFTEQLKKFNEDGRMQENETELVSTEKMLCFLRTDLAGRMMKAAENGLLMREQPFVLGIQATRLNPDFPEDEQVLIQGIIDVLFEEEGEIVLLDYKTDAVKSGEELVKRYQSQLKYYCEAIERIMGKKVKEKLLYSFSLNEVIPV